MRNKFISEYDKLCHLRKFLWLVDDMAMNAEIPETSKHDFVFSYSCSSLLLLLRFRVHLKCDCGCEFLDFCQPEFASCCSKVIQLPGVCASQAAWCQRHSPFSPELVLLVSRAVSPVETWKRVHLRLCILFQI